MSVELQRLATELGIQVRRTSTGTLVAARGDHRWYAGTDEEMYRLLGDRGYRSLQRHPGRSVTPLPENGKGVVRDGGSS